MEQVYPDPYWREYVVHDWEGRWNGLSMRGADEVERVATCVFPSDVIVEGLAPGTFLFSEHPVDFADEPGFLPLSLETYEAMRENGISFYNVHAPLDMHPEVSPSRLCAQGVGLERLEEYFPICEGIPAGRAWAADPRCRWEARPKRLPPYLAPGIRVPVPTGPGPGGGACRCPRRGPRARNLTAPPRGASRDPTPSTRTQTPGSTSSGRGWGTPAAPRRWRSPPSRRDTIQSRRPPRLAMARGSPNRGLKAGSVPTGPKEQDRGQQLLAPPPRRPPAGTFRRVDRREEVVVNQRGLAPRHNLLLLKVAAKGASTAGGETGGR